MKTKVVIVSAVAWIAAFGIPTRAHGATVMVDWLQLAVGGAASSFSLLADDGLPAAQGSLAIVPGKGIAFPGFPMARNFNAGFWSAETGFSDTVTGNESVTGFDIRIAPQGGMAAYTLTLNVPAGRELVVAVGGLYRGSAGATQSIAIAAFSSAGSGTASLERLVAWDGGSGAFDQELEWNAGGATLSTTIGADGDSEIAFLRVAPLSGTDRQIVLGVPAGYPVGTGDSLSIAIGTVVPEPGNAILAGIGTLVLLARRRR